MARDWQKTLWPASYKGMPFWVEREEAPGKRRIVTHEFPMRDDPFLEDLGEGARTFVISAYLASDAADVEAKALEGAFASSGAGLLVLPLRGPVQVRCLEWQPVSDRDTQGYVSYRATFGREGASIAVTSVGHLASEVFAASAALSAVASSVIVSMELIGLGSQVASTAVSAYQDAVASLEMVRASVPLDPDSSASARDALAVLYAGAPNGLSRRTGVDSTLGGGLVDAARSMVDGMDPVDAQGAFGDLSDASVTIAPAGPPVSGSAAVGGYSPRLGTPAQQAIARNAVRLSVVARMAALAAYAEALVSRSYASRPDGIQARADAAERFGAALGELQGSEFLGAYAGLSTLRNHVVDYLSLLINDLAPVITVRASRSLPSICWAWRLYGDPNRASELAARNAIKHPGFMPRQFEALAR